MTIEQTKASLASVDATFFMSSAKCILDSDPAHARPSYHIKPATSGGEYGVDRESGLVRVFSQAQLLDWVQTVKAARRITDSEKLEELWEMYFRRSYGRAASEHGVQ